MNTHVCVFTAYIIDKRSIKILTLGIVGTLPFIYSLVSGTYIMSKVNKYIAGDEKQIYC